jgi:hypothetical protein
LQVPYSIRMAADVMAQVLASLVQSIEARERARLVEASAEVRTRVMETLLHHDEPARALLQHAPALCQSLQAEALVVTQYGKVMVHGEVDAELAARMVASLPEGGADLVERSAIGDWPLEMQAALAPWAGLAGAAVCRHRRLAAGLAARTDPHHPLGRKAGGAYRPARTAPDATRPVR